MSTNYETTASHNRAALISAIASHLDRAAFATLFEFYATRIKAMMMRAGASADESEKLAGDTMLAVWRKSAHFDPDRVTASTWIYTIARDLWIDTAQDNGYPPSRLLPLTNILQFPRFFAYRAAPSGKDVLPRSRAVRG
jgi:RNA polymerase sigma-70 factor (ECF subfamily)